MNNVSKTIPRAGENEVVVIPPGKSGIQSSMEKRVDRMDGVVYGIMIAIVLAIIAVIISVIGLFLDQMRFNNQVYREYSEKLKSVETTQKINENLLKELKDVSK